jgi:alanyl-tRNA synthetase
MVTKAELIKQFNADWQKHYALEIFKEKGFVRKTCTKCGKIFWTLDAERTECADASCQPYGFILKRPKKVDYVETWKKFEAFWVRNGHAAVKRYPVICRWRDDLYFTIASITDFQRWEDGRITFEWPSDKLIVPQISVRFNDIPNVGVTGRHLTGFNMAGQHAFGHPNSGYWKDECIRLNFEILTKEFGIPETDLVYIEDVWNMPDFSAYGPSIETHSKGLEIVNSVFMQYSLASGREEELATKVIDVGWGFGRLPWYLSGAPTLYDVEFGPVVGDMKKKSGLKFDSELFLKYARIAGVLDVEEVRDLKKARAGIAKQVGVSTSELAEKIEPMQAIYAVADHARTLAFAISDGGLPSNAGGGYNLRIIARRALSFIDEFSLPFTIQDVADWHAHYLRPMYPELLESVDKVGEIIAVEEKKYKESLKRTKQHITELLKQSTSFDTPALMKLYESHGITPELIAETASKEKIKVSVPEDFYTQMTERHMTVEAKPKKEGFDTEGLAKTEALYYGLPPMYEFDAKVLRCFSKEGKHWAVLDKTAFYPESGGEHPDNGLLGDRKVVNVQKQDGVIFHELDGPLEEGKAVPGKIDVDRRQQLTRHHTAAHIINGAARAVLGEHVWQAGAEKAYDKARLDITHYESLTEEQTKKIEEISNKVIAEDRKVVQAFMPRGKAEAKYGFRLYQGGAVPSKDIRVIDIPGFDVEACGGTHCENTAQVERIRIIGSKKIQDGIVRITFVAGRKLVEKAALAQAAERSAVVSSWVEKNNQVLEEIERYLGQSEELATRMLPLINQVLVPDMVGLGQEQLFEMWKALVKIKEQIAKELSSTAAEPGVKYLPNADMGLLQGTGAKTIKTNPSSYSILVSEGLVFAVVGPSCTADIEAAVQAAARTMGGKAGRKGNEWKGGGPLKDKAKEAYEAAKKIAG